MLRAMSTYVGVTERLHPGMLDALVRAAHSRSNCFARAKHFGLHKQEPRARDRKLVQVKQCLW